MLLHLVWMTLFFIFAPLLLGIFGPFALLVSPYKIPNAYLRIIVIIVLWPLSIIAGVCGSILGVSLLLIPVFILNIIRLCRMKCLQS